VNANTENVDIHWVRMPVELSGGTPAVGRPEQVQRKYSEVL